ncbi:MAG: hypothetical protein CVV47_09470 [Spirochaetae bacterium HGW-Spirochaetae-3]|jgi:AcrR family transcriptional regulator|nr:MAG: hypothetical protein CVV47_09470 [Spirochaetae bacterium HGW-Spirochaetae-3]
MPKIVDYDARRKEIAEKTVAVLVRDGFRELKLGKVADLCGIGRTTIYQYFRNIGQIIDFALADVFRTLNAEIDAVTHDQGIKPTDKLLRIMDYLERVAILDKESMILVLDFLLHPNREMPGVGFNVQEHVRALRVGLERILTIGIDAGEIRPLDPKSMAFTLFSFVEAATVNSILYGNISLEDTLRDMRILMEGLRA